MKSCLHVHEACHSMWLGWHAERGRPVLGSDGDRVRVRSLGWLQVRPQLRPGHHPAGEACLPAAWHNNHLSRVCTHVCQHITAQIRQKPHAPPLGCVPVRSCDAPRPRMDERKHRGHQATFMPLCATSFVPCCLSCAASHFVQYLSHFHGRVLAAQFKAGGHLAV